MAIWGLKTCTGPEIEAEECRGRAKGEVSSWPACGLDDKVKGLGAMETRQRMSPRVVMAEGTRRVCQELSGKV
jgi:hypothetical protein